MAEEVVMGRLRMEPKVKPLRFVEVPSSNRNALTNPPPIVIHLGQVRIDVPQGFHANTLRQILELLEQQQ